MGKPTPARTTPYKTTPLPTASGPGSLWPCHGWPSMAGEYMWKRRWSRTPLRRRTLLSTPTHWSLHFSVSLFARKGAYPPGYRREPSAGRGGHWGPFLLLPCQAGCLSVTGGVLGCRCVRGPRPGNGGSRPPQSRCGPSRAAFSGLIMPGFGPRLALR